MEFKEFVRLVEKKADELFSDRGHAFLTNVTNNSIYETYLSSFPKEKNGIFRERSSHDCQTCKHFITRLGRCVVLDADGNKASVWDLIVGDETYQHVADKLSELVHSAKIEEFFIPEDHSVGTPFNVEVLDDFSSITWHHFFAKLPDHLPTKQTCDANTKKASIREKKNLLMRGLTEITVEAVDTVISLIKKNDLYRGQEYLRHVENFYNLKLLFDLLDDNQKDPWCWYYASRKSKILCGLKNTVIGTLLVDLSSGIETSSAISKYNLKVDPSKYRRSLAKAKSANAVKDAQKTIEELGFTSALPRRYGRIGDIGINDILFGSEAANQQISEGADIFTQLINEVEASNPNNFKRVEEVSIEHFLTNVLPNVSKLEAYFEPRHRGNLVSLTAPQNSDAASMFRWSNGLGWAYSGNMTDSAIRQNVKAAGGKVDGVLMRYSIQWNDYGDNLNDFDAHCIEPTGYRIHFPQAGIKQKSSGILDVDVINPTGVAVENIVYTDLDKMPEGIYTFKVHNFTHRGGTSGFQAEIEFAGQTFHFNYNKNITSGRYVEVAKVKFSKKDGFSLVSSLDTLSLGMQSWGLSTNAFHEVQVLMNSPNHWDSEEGLGNKHYFFMLAGCQNPENPNGFYNEFLAPELTKHRKVFEMLGERMMVQDAKPEEQLSGLGFSSTQRNSVFLRAKINNDSKIIKVIF